MTSDGMVRAGRDSTACHWSGVDPRHGRVSLHAIELPLRRRPPGLAAWLVGEAAAIARIAHAAWPAPLEIRETGDGGISLVYPEHPPFAWDTVLRGLAYPAPLGPVLALAHGIFDAVAAAEAAGYVHGGLKPDRVFANPDGSGLRIAAPSLRKVMQSIAHDQIVVGGVSQTLSGFESPESLVRATITLADDRWSAAAIVYESLTGWPPYEVGPFDTLMERLAQEGIVPTRVRRPDAPERIASMIDQALCLDPAKRPASAAELSAAWNESVGPLR